MKIVTMKYPVAGAIAGAMLIGLATTSWAAPVLSNAAALAGPAPNAATRVDDRSRGILLDLSTGRYAVQPTPSTPTPSNDVTALPRDTNRNYGTTHYPNGTLDRRQR
jgi:hypothetical protein